MIKGRARRGSSRRSRWRGRKEGHLPSTYPHSVPLAYFRPRRRGRSKLIRAVPLRRIAHERLPRSGELVHSQQSERRIVLVEQVGDVEAQGPGLFLVVPEDLRNAEVDLHIGLFGAAIGDNAVGIAGPEAAAVDQLDIWSKRVDVPIIKQAMGSDPASVAFDTVQSAVAQEVDVAIIDTAGRLHNKINLMNELSKIKRVMQKVIPDAPHEILLVLDASTGQNAIEQAKQFTLATEVNALALTKLDGTAKGGVVIGISDEFRIPVKYIGVGEKMEDLQAFNKHEFVDSLFNGSAE